MKKLILFSILLFAFRASADILFVDFNDADQEYQAAKDAADKRGEKVIRIPDKSDPRKPSEQLATMNQKMAQLNSKGVKLSSVVISGHDGNGYFSGVNGSMQSSDMSEAFESNPGMMKNVRSVLLWGCYTTNLGSLDGHWRKIFPNVGVFAGFDGRAPSKIREGGQQYLKDFLIADKDLIKARDKEERWDIIQKIHGFNQYDSSICVGNFIITPAGEHDITKLRQECGSTPAFDKGLEIYHCYLEAKKPECQDPPSSTDETCAGEDLQSKIESNPDKCMKNIRDFYTLLNAKSFCADYWNQLREAGVDIPEGQSVQALLFFKNVKANLGKLHKGDLAKIDSQLRDLGAPANLKVSDLSKLNRHDLLERLGAIQAFLDRKDPGPEGGETSVKRQQVQEGITELSGMLSNFKKYPPTWHEPSTYPSLSLQSAMSDVRTKEIRTEQYAGSLESRDFGKRKALQSAEMDKAKAKWRQAQKRYAEASQGEKPQLFAELDKATDEYRSARTKADREIAKDLVAEVKAEMKGKSLTADQKAGYDLYLKKLEWQAAH